MLVMLWILVFISRVYWFSNVVSWFVLTGFKIDGKNRTYLDDRSYSLFGVLPASKRSLRHFYQGCYS